MNRYDLSYKLHSNMLDDIKQVFEEISINVKSRIEEINDQAQSMSADDVEYQLADEYYYYSETYYAINNNIYLAHIISALEVYLKRLMSIYINKHPTFKLPKLGRVSFMKKFEGFLDKTGCSFDFTEKDWQDLDAFRAIRNGFIHEGAAYSGIGTVGQVYIDNNPSFFCVQTIQGRDGSTKKTTLHISNDELLIHAIDSVKRVTDKITAALKAKDI